MVKILFSLLALAFILPCSGAENGENTTEKGSFMQSPISVINGHEYVDLGLSVKWATYNVGAMSPEDYGSYYWWFDAKSTAKSWGDGWRLPTKEEFRELLRDCDWIWTKHNGVNGYEVKSKKNGNSLFFPATGYREGDILDEQSSFGYYWSSTPDGTDYAYHLFFDSGSCHTHWCYRDYRNSVRLVFGEQFDKQTTAPYCIGDYYNENGKKGVVFEVWDDGCHGKIISLDETTTVWDSHLWYDASKYKYVNGSEVGASSETDGKANSDKLMGDNFKAAAWCRAKGDGWYLPSVHELKTIGNNLSKIKTALEIFGTNFSEDFYHWTSTEYDEDSAWSVRMNRGYINNPIKSNAYRVRAVSVF